ncbi:MAG: Txe/YoeB family addiction module toxin [Dehalococcoidia bacterium]|nr:Txe/YoeB family addiction module toxin [Dehalococcoidia bacterium]
MTYATIFERGFREDLLFWVRSNPATAVRILRLVEEIAREPMGGIGKPEPLKHLPGSVWSRRINGEHRLVYSVEGDKVHLLQCRFHYGR